MCATPSPILQKFDLKICQCLVYYTFAHPAKVWLKDMSMSCVLHLRLSCKSLTWRYVNVLCTTPSPILQRRFDLMPCVLHLSLSCKSLTWSYVNVLCTTPSPILQKFVLKLCQCLVYYTFAYPAKVWLTVMSMSCVLHLRLSCKGGLSNPVVSWDSVGNCLKSPCGYGRGQYRHSAWLYHVQQIGLTPTVTTLQTIEFNKIRKMLI